MASARHRSGGTHTPAPRKTRNILIAGVAGAAATALAAVGLPALTAAAMAAPTSYSTGAHIVSDDFSRTTSGGWGSAQVGGAYSVNKASAFSTANGAGTMSIPRPGASLTASLPSVSAADLTSSATIAIPTIPTKGNGVYAGVQVRSTGSSYYQANIRVGAGGSLGVSIIRVNGSTASQTTVGREVQVAKGLKAGASVQLQFQATGSDPVHLQARAWQVGAAQPGWQLTADDSASARLTGAGRIAAWSYLSSASAIEPVAFDDLEAYALKAAGSAPATTAPASSTPASSTPTPTATPTSGTTPTPTPTPSSGTAPSGDAGIDQGVARASAGSAPIGTTAYPVPSGAYFVATGGSDGVARSSESAPWQTVQHAVDSVPSGSTIVVRGGTYHETVTIPRGKQVTIQAYPHEAVWFDGSRTVGSWAKSGSTWVSGGWNVAFDDSPTYTRGAPDGTASGWQFVDPAYPMAAHPDQLFVDGVSLKQVASRSAVTAGTFYVDTAAKQLVMGSDPSGHDVRASDTVKAFVVLGDGSALKGVGIRRYAPSVPDMGAVQIYANNVTVANSSISDNATTGLAIGGLNATVDHVTVARNGMLGAQATYADGLKVNGLLAQGNNSEHFNRAPVAGGLKVARSRGITVTGSNFLGNYGNALWFDESVYNASISNSDIIGNSGNGLVAEISAKFAIANNVIAQNGIAGILVSDTGTVDIRNNTLTGNARDINIAQGTRRASDLSVAGHDPRQALPDPTVTWITQDITVANNIMAQSTGDAVLAVEDYSHWHSAAQMNIQTQGNVYQRPSAGSPNWLIVWSRGAGNPAVYTTLSDFTAATGQDRTSRLFDGQNVLASDYTPLPVVTGLTSSLGVPFPAAAAALTGKPAGSLQLGAWG